MKQDHYTGLGNGSYLVRSLYFDTYDYASYHDRNDGFFGRIKLRMRAYTDSHKGNTQVLVEMKTKKGAAMEKYGTFISFRHYLHFLQRKSWNGPHDPILEEFERLYRVRNLEPVLLVQYRREAYYSRDRLPIRVTLDHNVHSCRARQLFPQNLLLKPHRPKHIVLEIKARREHEPDWLRRIVKKHSLKCISNSKYVQGIEIVRPHMVTPGIAI